MNSDLVWAMVRMLVTLPIVLGLIYLVLKYGLARRYVTTNGQRRMKLVEQLPLGPKSALSLVTLGGVYYLLAHQENSVSLVKELGKLPEMDELKVADVVELKPHSIKDYDLGQVRDGGSVERKSPVPPGEKFVLQLKRLVGQAAYMRRSVMAKLTGRMGDDGKGGKKIEG
ncbi:MAG: flagellar biosynthetic protein FliO [Desulfotomaculaceae bacterium]|nr:flagellar biosynthetic protein FliO [Desulfotomaculaceae bacterium]